MTDDVIVVGGGRSRHWTRRAPSTGATTVGYWAMLDGLEQILSGTTDHVEFALLS